MCIWSNVFDFDPSLHIGGNHTFVLLLGYAVESLHIIITIIITVTITIMIAVIFIIILIFTILMYWSFTMLSMSIMNINRDYKLLWQAHWNEMINKGAFIYLYTYSHICTAIFMLIFIIFEQDLLYYLGILFLNFFVWV